MDIFQCIVNPKASVSLSSFMTQPRWTAFTNKSPCLVVRFQSSQPSRAEPGEQLHGLSVTFDTEVLFNGVGMLVGNHPIDVLIRIFDQDKTFLAEISQEGLTKMHPLCSRKNIGSACIFPLYFFTPVLIHPNRKYTIVARVNIDHVQSMPRFGSRLPIMNTCVGLKGKNTITFEDINITFSHTDMISKTVNKSDVSSGQMPALYFFKRG